MERPANAVLRQAPQHHQAQEQLEPVRPARFQQGGIPTNKTPGRQ